MALKVLAPQAARDEQVARRFQNEIHALYRVSHFNVVRGYEFFRFGDGMAFTMEFIDGTRLSELIPSGKPMPLEEVLILLPQMCAGIHSIHCQGIIHRDLKPENIMVTNDGVVKITDFSIARFDKTSQLTAHGGVLGTVDYAAPEYLDEGEIDERADIYAFGIIMYQMITGVLPFEGQNFVEKVHAKMHYELKPPHLIQMRCPEELGWIVEKACRRVASERYQSALEIARDLLACGLIKEQALSGFYFVDEEELRRPIFGENTRANRPKKNPNQAYTEVTSGNPNNVFLEPIRPPGMPRLYRNMVVAVGVLLLATIIQVVIQFVQSRS